MVVGVLSLNDSVRVETIFFEDQCHILPMNPAICSGSLMGRNFDCPVENFTTHGDRQLVGA